MSQRNIRRNRGFQFQYAHCEPRQLLATIALNGSELLLGGNSTDDIATVSIAGDELTASLTGAETQTFPVADVTAIRFVGLGGDDFFTNETSLPSFAFGHAGNDTLIGGSGNDRFIGGTGNDTLTGNAGDDELRGGADGTKVIDGGAGNDRLFGGTGLNTLRGGAGGDVIYGGGLGDSVFGEAGNDFLFPGQGDNVVRGGAGDDIVIAGVGDDTIFGDAGSDRLFGGLGNDEIDGGAGNDSVVGRAGNDVLRGGSGNDFIRGNDGDDLLFGQAGDDRLQGDRGDDRLVGGTNTDGGFDRVLLDGTEGRYRIAGTDLFSNDRLGDDGFDDLDELEWIHYLDADNPGSHAAVSQIAEVVTIQPIITSNDDGSNTAEFFGNAEEELAIKSYINDIWYQARIQVNFLDPIEFNSSLANVGDGETRPFVDAFEIIELGEAAGVTHSDPLTLNMFLIEIAPGGGDLGENTVNGVALDGDNGITIQVGDELPTFDAGRRGVARVTSHEIAHNLGLDHVFTESNLLNFPEVTGSLLTESQVATLIGSRFSR